MAVLVAINIPIFTSQLEKSREATDTANARAAYAEMMASAVMGESCTESNTSYTVATTGSEGSFVYTATIPCTQAQTDWQNTSIKDIAGLTPPTTVGSGNSIVITYTQSTDTLAIEAK